MEDKGASDAMKRALEFKQEGNQYYKSKQLTKALSKYARAFMFIQAIEKQNSLPQEVKNSKKSEQEERKWTQSDEQLQEMKKLKAVLYLNQAAIFLIQQIWHKAEEKASKALEISTSVKGYFRRAQARVELGDPTGALDDLSCAKKLEPANETVDEQIRVIKARRALIFKKQSSMFDFYKKSGSQKEAEKESET